MTCQRKEWTAPAPKPPARPVEEAGDLRTLRAVVDQSPLSIVITDACGRIEYVNPQFSRLTGYALDEIRGKKSSILQSGRQNDAFYEELWKAILAGREWQGEFRNKKKNGELYWEWARIAPILEAGKITHFIASKEDITQRKWRELEGLARQQLRQAVWDMRAAKDMHRVVRAVQRGLETLEVPFDGYCVNLVDAAVDPPQVQIYTLESDGELGSYAAPPGERAAILERWRGQEPAPRDGCPARMPAPALEVPFSHGTLSVGTPAGAALAESHVQAVRSLAEVLSEGFRRLEDLLRLENQEKQLLQAQKMEAIGLLAGGVAHDFNNLITVISGYSQVLLQARGLDGGTRQGLEEIGKAGERASVLVRQLLTFSRRQAVEPEVLECNSVVGEIERMLVRLIGEDIELETDLDPQAGPVRMDPGHLEQILVNLAVNARDAMPEGGKLRIRSAPVRLEGNNEWGLLPGPYVRLGVEDSGAGMERVVVDRIFEPFFTTKEQSQGTGLGLSTVYGIVRQNDGHIAVHSQPGVGTRFDIYLPLAGMEAALDRAKARVAGAVPGPTGKTVLVVEDEKAVRKLVVRLLNAVGLEVLEAAGAEEALELAAGAGPLDLLLTDVVMPQMDGPRLYEKLTEVRPELPVLYMSGYTRGIGGEELCESDNFMQKPFSPEELVRKVRKKIDRPQSLALGRSARQNEKSH